jgi:hypothetical protein
VKRAAFIALLAAVGLVVGIWWAWRPVNPPQLNANSSGTPERIATNATVTATTPPTPGNPGTPPLIGETILRGYADTNRPPENDLTLMSRLMENSLLLLKSAGNRPLSANEDWVDLLRGRNAAQEQFLPATHVALNTNGQLVDRWGTPLFFHALGSGRYELRSAGPDKKLWTADDIHRNADGSFRRGAELNSQSLLETAIRGRSPSTGP